MARQPLKECTSCGKSWKKRTPEDATMCPYCGATTVRDARMSDRASSGRGGGCGCVVVLLILLAAAGGGYYWWFHLRQPTPPPAATSPPTPQPTPEPATDEPPTPTQPAAPDGDGDAADSEVDPAVTEALADLAEVYERLLEAQASAWFHAPTDAAETEARRRFVEAIRQRLTSLREQVADRSDELASAAAALERVLDAALAGQMDQVQAASAAFIEQMRRAGGDVPEQLTGLQVPAAAQSREWFELARNYHRAGRHDLARRELEKILEAGDPEWVDKAQALLREIDAAQNQPDSGE